MNVKPIIITTGLVSILAIVLCGCTHSVNNREIKKMYVSDSNHDIEVPNEPKENIKLSIKSDTISFPCGIDDILRKGISIQYSEYNGGFSSTTVYIEKKDLSDNTLIERIGAQKDLYLESGNLGSTSVYVYYNHGIITGCSISDYESGTYNDDVKFGDLHVKMYPEELIQILGDNYYIIGTKKFVDSYVWPSSEYGVVEACFMGESTCQEIKFNENLSNSSSNSRIIWSADCLQKGNTNLNNYQIDENINLSEKSSIKHSLDCFVDGVNSNNSDLFLQAFEGWNTNSGLHIWNDIQTAHIIDYYVSDIVIQDTDEYDVYIKFVIDEGDRLIEIKDVNGNYIKKTDNNGAFYSMSCPVGFKPLSSYFY